MTLTVTVVEILCLGQLWDLFFTLTCTHTLLMMLLWLFYFQFLISFMSRLIMNNVNCVLIFAEILYPICDRFNDPTTSLNEAVDVICVLLSYTHLLFWHAPLGVHSIRRRHPSPEWTILSHVNCFIQGEVIGFQVLLDSLHLLSVRASQWSPPVLQMGSC